MKRHQSVSSSRRKSRKAHFDAPSSQRRKIMSCRLSKKLKDQHSVRSIPIRRGDEVKILKGKGKNKTGKVVQVYRKRWCIYVDKVNRDKQNGQTVFLPIKPSYCVIENLQLNKDRKELLERKSKDTLKSKNKGAKLD
jgi:large subunit ribosomal protein L26e